MDYNFNFSHCIKEAHSFGSDNYYNICSGTNTSIPWGSLDWMYAILGLVAVAVFVTAMVTGISLLAYGIYTEYKNYSRLT